MPKFKVTATYQQHGEAEIEAENIEDAIEKLRNNVDLFDMGDAEWDYFDAELIEDPKTESGYLKHLQMIGRGNREPLTCVVDVKLLTEGFKQGDKMSDEQVVPRQIFAVDTLTRLVDAIESNVDENGNINSQYIACELDEANKLIEALYE